MQKVRIIGVLKEILFINYVPIVLQISSQFSEGLGLVWTVVGTPPRDMPSTSWIKR